MVLPPPEQHALLEQTLALLGEDGYDGFGKALEILINATMALERTHYLNAGHYERTAEREGYANGYKPKTLNTRVGTLNLKVPQTRDGFYPSSLEKGTRSERALKASLAEMYVNGVSTRKVTKITEELCGLEVTSAQVSRVTAELDKHFKSWRNRKLGVYRYLWLDARYEKVRYENCVVDCAVLVAMGVNENGNREVLGVSVSLSEAEVHWREFLQGLQARGLSGVTLIISDAHTGLGAARAAVFSGIPWQRCQFHLQQNAQAYVSHVAQRTEVAGKIRAIFNAPNLEDAQRLLKLTVDYYADKNRKLADWLEDNLEEGFTVFSVAPPALWKKLRTSNPIERLNREIKRRTKVAVIFPNTEACLRLVTAVLVEHTEDWQTDKRYMTLE